MKNDLIRDRLVVRIWDSALSEWLQLNATLILDDAVKQIRQREVVHEHLEQHRLQPAGKWSTILLWMPVERLSLHGKKNCSRCGRNPHAKESCPAYNAILVITAVRRDTVLLCASPREQALNAPNATLTQVALDHSMEQYPDDSHLDMAYFAGTLLAFIQNSWGTGHQWTAVLDN